MPQTQTIPAPVTKKAKINILRVQGLKKAFGTNRVLEDFNLELEKDENLVVLGRSGTGKSVLIKCIIGLLEPDAGKIEVFGKPLPDPESDDMDRIRMKIGFLFQSNALYDSMTVRENLEFPLRRHSLNITRDEINTMVMEALESVGLAHTIDMMPAELSGGMRKRIALARTLILKPEIILYDEPTTGLDPITGKEISELMMEISDRYHTSSVIITHDMNCVKRTADRILVLMDGRCRVQGTFEELMHSADPLIKPFFE